MQSIKNQSGNAVEKVFIVPYSHIDWQWRNNRRFFIHRNRQVIFAALDFLDKEKSYRWEGIHRVHVFEDFWNKYPEFRQKLKKFVREGRIDVTGSALSTPLFPWYEEEALMRNLAYGKKCYEVFFGKLDDPTLYFADVPNAFAQLPQIAAKFGFKYYIIDRPETALTAKGMPREFVFQSPDGSKVLCNQTMYGLSFPGGGDHFRLSPGRFEKKLEQVAKRISFIAQTSLVPVTYIPDAEDWAFPSLNLPEFISFWNKRVKTPKLVIATHTEYFRKLEIFRDKLPVFSGNLDPISWNGVYGMNGEKPNMQLRKLVGKILLTEKLDVLRSLLVGGKHSSAINLFPCWKEINELYEHGFYSTSHTFPEDHHDCGRRIAEMSRELSGKMKAAAESVTEKNKKTWVFNPLSWERKEWIEQNGKVFQVETPSLGYACPAVIAVKTTDLAAGDNFMENQYYRLKFRNGRLTGVYLKEHDREWLNNSPCGYAGTILIDEGDITLLTANFLRRHQASYGKNLSFVRRRHKITAVLKGKFRGNMISQEITLLAGMKGIHVKTKINNREPDLRYRISFPLGACGKPRIFGDDLFIVEEKNLEAETLIGLSRSKPGGFESFFETAPKKSRGENKGVFYGLRFAALEDDEIGAAIFNRGTIGYVAERNLLSNILLRSSRKENMDEYVYPHLLGIGKFVFENVLYPYRAGSRTEVFKSALEFNNPLFALPGRTAKSGEKRSLLKISAPNVILSAFYREGNKFCLHLYEIEGKPDRVKLEFVRPVRDAVETDFLEHKIGRLHSRNRNIFLDFKPFEIKKVKVSFEYGKGIIL